MFGWFKKKEVSKVEEEAAFTLQLPNVKPGNSFLGPSLLISGKITGGDDVQLLGQHDGSIELNGDLSIREGAVASGWVAARSISVSGSVEGDLRASRKLSLLRTARVTGTIAAPVARVEEGALVDGKVQMDTSD